MEDFTEYDRPSESDRPHRVVKDPNIRAADISDDALRVLSRLQRSGFEAYLVGGCVRDLLLGRTPKDFDVATDAHPRQIKRLFRNGRIIGKRFRLVHIVYGDHVIETSTFRCEPLQEEDDGDLLIREDNEFGTAEEDARRRDFTINGLFYDPNAGELHDWVDGLDDLEAGTLRTIGDPDVRIAEDPVRILRAIKFATRLGFRIEEETWRAMIERSDELTRSAAPRVLEEILRLMRSGTALGAFRMMRACGALRALLPSVDRFLGARNDPDPAAHDRADQYWRLLEALDADIHAGNEPSNSVLLAVLFLRLIERRVGELEERARSRSEPVAPPVADDDEGADDDESGGREPRANASEWADVAAREIDPIASRARLPRRAIERAKRIIASQVRFTQASSKSFRPLLFLRSAEFPEALHLFRLRSAAWGQGWELYEAWSTRYARALEVPEEEIEAARRSGRSGRRRRRRRGRKRPGRRRESGDG